MTGREGFLPRASSFSPSRGSIRSSASAVSEVVERVWIRGADSPPQACFFSLLTGAVRVRSNAGRHGQTQRNSFLGGAAKSCCQTIPRLLNGALQMPSFAAVSASTALRTSARVVESCRGLLFSASRPETSNAASFVFLDGSPTFMKNRCSAHNSDTEEPLTKHRTSLTKS